MVRYDMFDRDTRVEQESYESDVTTSHGHAKQVLVVFVMDGRPMPQQDLYRFWATQRVEQKAVTTLEDAERISRRVLGGAHPTTEEMEDDLRDARALLRARETPSTSA